MPLWLRGVLGRAGDAIPGQPPMNIRTASEEGWGLSPPLCSPGVLDISGLMFSPEDSLRTTTSPLARQ